MARVSMRVQIIYVLEERMPVMVSTLVPVSVQDAGLERGVTSRHPVAVMFETDAAHESADERNGRLANADDGSTSGLDERNFHAAQNVAQVRGSHPTG